MSFTARAPATSPNGNVCGTEHAALGWALVTSALALACAPAALAAPPAHAVKDVKAAVGKRVVFLQLSNFANVTPLKPQGIGTIVD